MAKLLFMSVVLVIAVALIAADEFCTLPGYPDIKFKKGEKVPHPKECQILTCLNPPDGIGGLTCPAAVPAPNCHFTEIDNSKRYPECCPQHVCD